MPLDPQSGGTWIGANSAGLVLALLNKAPTPPPPPLASPLSRGTIIPQLLAHASVGAAAAVVGELPLGRFEPFQLLLLDLGGWATIQWDGQAFTLGEKAAVVRPVLLTSSNLGDALVAHSRRALFERCFNVIRPWESVQDTFHRHQWPEQPELSVCMRRPDSGTLSQTIIQLEPTGVHLAYFPGPPEQTINPVVVTLPLLI
jgi:hypothetical protein